MSPSILLQALGGVAVVCSSDVICEAVEGRSAKYRQSPWMWGTQGQGLTSQGVNVLGFFLSGGTGLRSSLHSSPQITQQNTCFPQRVTSPLRAVLLLFFTLLFTTPSLLLGIASRTAIYASLCHKLCIGG